MMSYKNFFYLAMIMLLIVSIGSVCANELENTTLNQNNGELEVSINGTPILESQNSDVIEETSDEITVDNWDDLQYYCSLNDKNYVLKLKENTNYYPTNPKEESYQIQVNNNVTIVGSSGAYFGDSSQNARSISYLPINVPENSGIGITLKGITFKWINCEYQPNAIFLQIAGNTNNLIENCIFNNCTVTGGHSSFIHVVRGNLTLTNSTFTNMTSDFGCLSLYDPKDDPTDICTHARGTVSNCYFEGNYARTEPGCINNCGVLVVRNSTFYRNTAFWWAGAIHTHGGANTTIYDSNFTDNVAGWNGGALYTYSYLQIYNTIFKGNNCTTNNGGGAIGACKYLHSPYIHIEDSLFDSNENLCWALTEESTSGLGRGGAISIMDEGGLTVLNTTFIKNSASIGTAICAITQGGNYGSPGVTIVGNRFINHTRISDVLVIKLDYDSLCNISDNYYYGNSIEFSKLKLIADDRVGDEVALHIDATLKNANYYDSDILDKSDYLVYVDGSYLKTVTGLDFTLNLKNIEKAQVYVVPSISTTKSNEVSVGMPKEYIYVSQKSGNDVNDGVSDETPVATLSKAIELANSTGNIFIMDGTFSDANLVINYDLSVSGNDGVVIASTGNIFDIGDVEVEFKNIIFKGSKQSSSSSDRIIKQGNGILNINNCTFESNSYVTLIETSGFLQMTDCEFNSNSGILIRANSYQISSSQFKSNTATTTKTPALIKSASGLKASIDSSEFSDNDVKEGCINFAAGNSNQNTLTITDCEFVKNNGNDGSSAILISGGLLDLSSTLFINNTDTGRSSAVIVTSTEIHVSDSIFIGNTYNNNNKLLINSKSSTGLKKIYCTGNWFGNNQNDYNIAPAISSSSNCENWIFLNATADATSMFIGENTVVEFNLNNAYNKFGNVTYWDSSNLPLVRLSILTEGGSSDKNEVALVNGIGKLTFTLNDVKANLKAEYNGVEDVINFTEAKVKPQMDIEYTNISVDDDEIITITLPDNATGEITLNLANVTQTQIINGVKSTFTLSDLASGEYVGTVTYSGDDYYSSVVKDIKFNVDKYNSTTSISIGDIEVGHDVLITVTVSPSVTGNVTLIINSKEETLNLVDSKATYTIKSITRGDYTIKAQYNGNYKFLESGDDAKFNVDKLDTDISIRAEDIVYGENAKVEITLNDDAGGNVTACVDGRNFTSNVENGKALINISNLNAGYKQFTVSYSGDNVYNPNNASASFNVAKANTPLTIRVDDIKIGHDVTIEVTVKNGVTGNITITCNNQNVVKSIPRTGKVSLTISDLLVGTYEVSAVLMSENYENAENNTLFEVSDYQTPQWPDEGYDSKNTGKSPYVSDSNGEILWTYSVNGDVVGNLAIDAAGNIYLITSKAIYSIDNNGKALWNRSLNGDGNLSAIAISRDVVIVPQAGNTINFINQTTGEKFGNSNIYLGSSLFAPVVDSNANIYISSEYQYGSEDYKLVIIPYKLWEKGGNPILISLGKSCPLSAPVIVDDSTVIVGCDDSLKIIDISNNQVLSSVKGNTKSIRPVVGPGNMIYVVLDDNICQITPQGSAVWKTKITDGTGKYLVLDEESGLYSINSKGNLYKYDLIDGSESLISNSTFTSGILVGNDGNVYVGCNDVLYSFDSDGNMLWKSDIKSEIIGSPIIGENGLIYVQTKNSIVALTDSPLKNPEISINVSDAVFGDDVTVSVGIDSQCVGEITLKIDNELYNEAISSQGLIVKNISNLNAGIHTVEVTFAGDARFTQKTLLFNFTVKKAKASIAVSSNDIFVGENVTVKVEMPQGVDGTVSYELNGKTYTSNVENGFSDIIISDLESGNYTIVIKFKGNDYDDCENTTSFKVLKVEIPDDSETIDFNVSESGEASNYSISLPADATGTLTVSVDGAEYTESLVNGKATVNVPELSNGTHNITVSYSGDSKYAPISKSAVVNVTKDGPVEKSSVGIEISVSDITLGEDAVIDVVFSDNVTGEVTITVDSKDYEAVIDNNKASVTVSGLAVGEYDVVAKYVGNDYYKESVNSTGFKVLKVDIPVGDETIVIPESGEEYSISLPADATGTLTVTVDGIDYTCDVVNGKASVNVSELSNGSHNITVSYSGDSKYAPISKSAVVNVTKDGPVEKSSVGIEISVSDITLGEDAVIDVVFSDNVTGEVTITVDSKDYEAVIDNNKASVTVSGLAVGEYDVVAKYVGNDYYKESVNSTGFKVLKVDIPVGDETIVIPESGEEYSISLPADATGTLTVTVDGIDYTCDVVNGKASVNVPKLSGGSHNITVAYSGDSKYSPIIKTSTVTVPVVKLTGYDLSMLYTSGKYYKIRLTKDSKGFANQTVKIVINGKTYTRTTDANGYASVKISLPPKTYAVTAVYGELKAKNKVVVKTIITAKNINAKRSAKTVKVSVTLKKVNSKYLKNKKVTLKFNKKTFKVKTNKKGVATFTIKNSVYKKLKTGKKYTYQVIYLKNTVKKTIKFKK